MTEQPFTPSTYRVAVPPKLGRGKVDLGGQWESIHPPRQASRKPTRGDQSLPAYAIEFRGQQAVYVVRCRWGGGPKVDAPNPRLADVVALADFHVDLSFIEMMESIPAENNFHPLDRAQIKGVATKLSKLSPGPWRIYRPSEGGSRVVHDQGEHGGYILDLIIHWRASRESVHVEDCPNRLAIEYLETAAHDIHALAERAKVLAGRLTKNGQ